MTLNLSKMTRQEKLYALELIWDDLRNDPDSIESPGWHGEVLEERARLIESGEAEWIPWEEAKKMLKERREVEA